MDGVYIKNLHYGEQPLKGRSLKRKEETLLTLWGREEGAQLLPHCGEKERLKIVKKKVTGTVSLTGGNFLRANTILRGESTGANHPKYRRKVTTINGNLDALMRGENLQGSPERNRPSLNTLAFDRRGEGGGDWETTRRV